MCTFVTDSALKYPVDVSVVKPVRTKVDRKSIYRFFVSKEHMPGIKHTHILYVGSGRE
jgi:hypothetical protein